MSTQALYSRKVPHNHFGSNIQVQAIGAPPGTSMQPQVLELLRDLPEELNLAQAALSTPWAGKLGDLQWQEIHKPDTNVQTFLIRDEDLQAAQKVLFGQPVPFVVIKTLDPVTNAEMEEALLGSPYDLFETQAVYLQSDPNPIPRIEFHHWVRRRPLETEGGKSMSLVAQQVGGDLLYGQQVPVENTSKRQPPAVSFQEAFDAQFLQPEPAPQPLPEPQPDPEPEEPVSPPPSPPVPFWGPALVAGSIALATVVIWKGWKR